MTNQATTTKEALEPCPLCGSTNLFLRDIGGWEIDCRDCELSLVLADDPSREGLVKRWNSRIPAPSVVPEVDENSVAFTAYNQAIEDAKSAIRDESQGGGYWAATFINAIARKCSPHVYVNRLAAPASPVVPVEQSGHDKPTPLCTIHQRLEDADKLECEIGNDCVACSLNERRELLALIAPFAAEGNTEDSVTVLRRVTEFYETHVGEGRVVVSYPVPASPVAPISKDAWSTWFDRLGDKASAEVVNATADLVTDERLAALVQAGVLPSPVAIRDEAEDFARRVVGTVFDNTAASHETLKQTMIERIADSVTPLSTAAKRIVEEWMAEVSGSGYIFNSPMHRKSLIERIERCLSPESEDQESTPTGTTK